MLPLSFNFPLINNDCAFALPVAKPTKSLSANVNVTSGFSAAAVLTLGGDALRSTVQDFV